jgi:hypothetical protein
VVSHAEKIVARGIREGDLDHDARRPSFDVVSACVRSAAEEIVGAELAGNVLERMSRAVVARGALMQKQQSVKRLDLFLELADALESVFIGGRFPDCHDRLLRG